ncbi:MAG: hypothetical protein WB460_15795, partial [Candidatus Acidiferrales bacterium]
MPKRYCTSRAEWRLQPGKPAEPLSPHYRLDCDFGTGVITCWEDGGSEPIYVCESHAKRLGQPRKQVTDIRIITPPSKQNGDPVRVEARSDIQEVAVASPIAAATVVVSRTLSDDAEAALAVDRTEIQEVAAPAPKSSPLPEAPGDVPVAMAGPVADQTEIQEVSAPPEKIFPLPEAPRSIPEATPEPAVDQPEIREVAAPSAKVPASPEAPARALPEVRATRVTESSARPPARDLTYGNPAKAMVDEAIWNMATGNYQAYNAALERGKSVAEAAEAAGGQLAMVHRKIGDYTLKMGNLLAESKATIGVGECIDKPLEQAVLDIIGNGAMSDSEKDAAVQQLGVIQEWMKHGLQGNITPLQANQIVLAIGDRVNWGGTADVPEEFKAVYRTLYGNLKTAIR